MSSEISSKTAAASPFVTITHAYDNAGDIVGDFNSGATVDDTTPTLYGQTVPNGYVRIYVNNYVKGYVTADAQGNWSFTLNELSSGAQTIRAELLNGWAKVASSEKFIINIGVAAPAITSVQDDAGAVTGHLDQNDWTDDARPEMTGTATAGNVVKIYDGATLLGSTVADASGNWRFTPTSDLSAGTHNLVAQAQDAKGNVSGMSSPWAVTVVAPPSITHGYDHAGGIVGKFNSGAPVDDSNPMLHGRAAPHAVVKIYVDAVWQGDATADASGNWSYRLSGLSEGSHTVTAELMNGSVLVSKSNDFVVLIDTTAPDAPTLNALPDATNENPTLGGTGTPGETIIIRDNGNEIGTAIVGEDGTWSFTPKPALGEGEHSLTVEAVDAAGNVSAPSAPGIVVIDTTAPDTPTLDTLPSTTNQNPPLGGTGTVGETIVIRDNGNEIGSAIVGKDGTWSFTPNPALGEGEHRLTVEAVDKAGNVSEPSAPGVIVIDLTPPDVPTFNQLPEFSRETPTLGGTGTAGETIVIRDNGREIGTAIVGEDGAWSFTPTPSLNEGEHSLTVEAVDAAGNVSAPSAPGLVVIDTTAPVSVATLGYISKDSGFSSTDLVTNDGSAPRVMAGTLTEALGKGEKVQVSLDNGTTWIDARVEGTNWFVMDDSAHSADWTILSRVVDAVGNIGTESSATVTLLQAADRPSAPLSMSPNSDGSVKVTFDPHTVKPGDRIVLSHYGTRYEHILTEAEIAAGVADVQANAAKRIDFYSDFTYKSTASSSSVDFQGLTLHFTGVVTIPTPGSGAIFSGPKTTIEIHGGTNSVSLKLSEIQGGATTYKFYDLEGNLIQTVSKSSVGGQYTPGVSAVGHMMEFQAPVGVIIGSFTIEPPTGNNIYLETLTLGMGGRADEMSAAIVDAAGNSSNFVVQSSSTISHEFEALSAQTLNVGQSRDIGSIKITALLASFDPILKLATGNHWWDTKGNASFLQVIAGSAVGIDLKGASATRFTAKFMDIHKAKSGQLLRFYDANNTLILTVDLNAYGTATDGQVNGFLSWDMPAGTSFTRLEIHGGTDRIALDGLRIDNIGEQSSALVETVQDIHSASSYQGDAANNLFKVADVSLLLGAKTAIDGGAGVDTLMLTGKDQVLDFSRLNGKIDSVEILDITGTGNNTLKLSLGDVLDLGVSNLFHTDGKVQVMVRGDLGDTVDLDDVLANGMDLGDWANKGSVDIGGVSYVSYQYSTLDAELLVQQGVTVNLV
jgi:hypothetical protein